MPELRITRTEPEGIQARPVLTVAAGFLAFVGACLAGIFFYYSDVITSRTPPQPEPFPAPQLQRTPLSDLQKLQQKQRAQLEGYAWIDKDQGIVRIPIERAMQIVASKGAAAFGSFDDLNKPPAPSQRNESAKAPNGVQR
jgi:hypothetical protein